MDWVVAVLVLGGLAAAGVEIWLARQDHPRRFVYAWLTWTPLALLGFGAVFWDATSPLASLILTVLVAVCAYPIGRGLVWMRFRSHLSLDRQAEEAALDAERMKYHAMDFGGVRAAPEPASTPAAPARVARPSPVAMPSATSRLDRATRGRRPAWVRGAEASLVFGVIAVSGALYVGGMVANQRMDDAPSSEEMIAATLEINGFASPRISSAETGCPDGRGEPYHWSAIGADGRACVDPYGEVSLWVEHRWPAMRPGLAAE